MSLQTYYRPQTFDEFFGNEALKESLSNALKRKKEIPIAFLLVGGSGMGKTTLGRIIAKELEIPQINQHIFNASNTRGIDTIRDIIDSSKFTPIHGKSNRRIYIMEECHQITGAGIESLLQFLEEPPDGVFIVLTTTEPDKLKITLKRRCFIGEVKPFVRNEMMRLFKSIMQKEKITFPKSVLEKAWMESNGSPGQALKILDTVIDLDEEKALEVITASTKSETSVIDLCRTLIDPNMTDNLKWKKCRAILSTIEGEPETIRRGVLGYLNKVLLSSGDALVAETMSNFIDNYYDSGKAGLTLSVFLSCSG